MLQCVLGFLRGGGGTVEGNVPHQIRVFPGNTFGVDVFIKDPLCRAVQRAAVGGDAQHQLLRTGPQRGEVGDRILSGLSLAVLVVEAPERSGALITADRALDQGRDVFVIPGQMGDPACAGSNRLIRDGAGLITCAWDILSHYEGQYPHKIRPRSGEEPRRFGLCEPSRPQPEEAPEPPAQPALPVLDISGDHGLTDDQIRIVKALQGRTMQVDDVIDQTQIPARRVLSALTMLEIDQIVTQESGKRFALAVTLA